MTTIEITDDLKGMYKRIFNEEPDEFKLQILAKQYGLEKLESVLEFFVINAPKPPAPGKKNNPYGLLYKVCGDWKI